MLKPKIKIHRITDIKTELLSDINIKGLILDVDNTLSTHHGDVLIDGLEDWLSYIKDSGIKLVIASNSKEKRVKPFAEKIGLDFVPLSCKPLPFGYNKACKKLGLKFAYNLDGGGSTETMFGYKHLNTIYDGTTGRQVPTFIVFTGSTSLDVTPDEVPETFEEVECIETDGNQYIDTDIV